MYPHYSQDSHASRRALRSYRAASLLAGMFLLAGLALVAACGSSNPSQGVRTPAPGAKGPYAYLYSRIDYPLTLDVNAGDTVRLTLSPQQNLLSVTPGPGSGVGTIGEPIPLPTDLSAYSDIGAAVDTESSGDSPVVWQLTSAPRQTLLTALAVDVPRRYLNDVEFHWHVAAVAPGQNTVRIVLHLYYVYLDGSEHDGTIEVSSSPTPIVAQQPSFFTETLPQLRLPLAGLSGLAGLLGVLRFIWDLVQNAKDARETAQSVAKAAVAVHRHVANRNNPQ